MKKFLASHKLLVIIASVVIVTGAALSVGLAINHSNNVKAAQAAAEQKAREEKSAEEKRIAEQKAADEKKKAEEEAARIKTAEEAATQQAAAEHAAREAAAQQQTASRQSAQTPVSQAPTETSESAIDEATRKSCESVSLLIENRKKLLGTDELQPILDYIYSSNQYAYNQYGRCVSLGLI